VAASAVALIFTFFVFAILPPRGLTNNAYVIRTRSSSFPSSGAYKTGQGSIEPAWLLFEDSDSVSEKSDDDSVSIDEVDEQKSLLNSWARFNNIPNFDVLLGIIVRLTSPTSASNSIAAANSAKSRFFSEAGLETGRLILKVCALGNCGSSNYCDGSV